MAYADAIDGAWCHRTGGRMVIQGPFIVTPAGTRTRGDYTRHSFAYVAPANDPGAGTAVRMLLMNEEEVRVRVEGSAEEIWRRCGPPVSLRPAPSGRRFASGRDSGAGKG
jgi:hypothetical protein